MTFAIGCVLAAATLPYVFLMLSGVPSATERARWGREYNHQRGRDSLEKLTGWRQRAHWAQMNGHEAFAPFAAAMILAAITHVSEGQLHLWGALFFAGRLLHGAFYLADRGVLRTLAWSLGATSTVALMIAALLAA